MSDQYDKLRVGLWKQDGQSGEYYSGSIEVGGEQYWVNLYTNDRKTTDKQPDYNLVLKPKEQRRSSPASNAARRAVLGVDANNKPTGGGIDDPEIPFGPRGKRNHWE